MRVIRQRLEELERGVRDLPPPPVNYCPACFGSGTSFLIRDLDGRLMAGDRVVADKCSECGATIDHCPPHRIVFQVVPNR